MAELAYNDNYVINGKNFVDTVDESNIADSIIPKHIMFTYVDISLVPNKVFDDWRNLHNDYKLIFFDDDDCIYFFIKKFGISFASYFTKIEHPPHKADFFRLCFLYKYGGIYMDIDIQPIESLNEYFAPYKREDVKLITSLSMNNRGCFQAIIITVKNNIIIKQNIDAYVNLMKNLKTFGGAPLGGVQIMYDVIKKILVENKIISIVSPLVPHKLYKISSDNNVLLLDEFSPNGWWMNCYVRNGYKNVCKSRYDNYPWFKHTLDTTKHNNLLNKKSEYEHFEMHLKSIENIINNLGVKVEGNCIYEHISFKRKDWLFTKQENLKLMGSVIPKKLCEIGFNAGHSMLLFLLSNKNKLDVTIFDINEHKYVVPCFDYIKNNFRQHNFQLTKGNSLETLSKYITMHPEQKETYDLVHVDGGHSLECIKNDLYHAVLLTKKHGYIIVDDTNVKYISQEADSYIENGVLIELDILKTQGYKHRIFQKMNELCNNEVVI